MSATAPAITYLRLDAEYDPILDPAQALTDLEAVAQIIQTALNLFQGEWWENLTLGLPVFQSMLGQLGSLRNQAAIKVILEQYVGALPFVNSCTAQSVSFVEGQLSYQLTADTAFGVVTISNTPGLTSSLGGQTS